ncbi:MAG: DUF5618 family protein [Candidatus Hydrothermia bacterium]|jgi:hypothetical protein
MKDGKNEIAIKRLNLAKRYLENAKEDLKKDGIDKKANCYIDLKYISKASGIAYLGALEALKALFIFKNLVSDEEVKNIEGLGKDRDLLLALFDDVYNILHLGGYYRELQDKKAIDSGFEKAQKIIKIVKSYVDLKLKD